MICKVKSTVIIEEQRDSDAGKIDNSRETQMQER